jgi:hypothetical protein
MNLAWLLERIIGVASGASQVNNPITLPSRLLATNMKRFSSISISGASPSSVLFQRSPTRPLWEGSPGQNLAGFRMMN